MQTDIPWGVYPDGVPLAWGAMVIGMGPGRDRIWETEHTARLLFYSFSIPTVPERSSTALHRSNRKCSPF
jgi:hypothetical protein